MQDPCDSQQASSHAPVGDDHLCRAWLLAEGHRTDAGFLRVFPTRKDGGGEASTLPAQEPGVLGGGGGDPHWKKRWGAGSGFLWWEEESLPPVLTGPEGISCSFTGEECP